MREHAPEPGTRDQAMATTSSSWRVVEDVPNGGLTYTCGECCKSFNRLASYKAHVRTHAGNELVWSRPFYAQNTRMRL